MWEFKYVCHTFTYLRILSRKISLTLSHISIMYLKNVFKELVWAKLEQNFMSIEWRVIMIRLPHYLFLKNFSHAVVLCWLSCRGFIVSATFGRGDIKTVMVLYNPKKCHKNYAWYMKTLGKCTPNLTAILWNTPLWQTLFKVKFDT